MYMVRMHVCSTYVCMQVHSTYDHMYAGTYILMYTRHGERRLKSNTGILKVPDHISLMRREKSGRPRSLSCCIVLQHIAEVC